MADWLGQASWLMQPLVDRITDHVTASAKIYDEDTPVPVQGHGRGDGSRTIVDLYPRKPTIE